MPYQTPEAEELARQRVMGMFGPPPATTPAPQTNTGTRSWISPMDTRRTTARPTAESTAERHRRDAEPRHYSDHSRIASTGSSSATVGDGWVDPAGTVNGVLPPTTIGQPAYDVGGGSGQPNIHPAFYPPPQIQTDPAFDQDQPYDLGGNPAPLPPQGNPQPPGNAYGKGGNNQGNGRPPWQNSYQDPWQQRQPLPWAQPYQNDYQQRQPQMGTGYMQGYQPQYGGGKGGQQQQSGAYGRPNMGASMANTMGSYQGNQNQSSNGKGGGQSNYGRPPQNYNSYTSGSSNSGKGG